MGVFPERSTALSNPSRPRFFWYPKAKSSTLNVPIHPLYLWIFQNFKTLLKFFLCNFSSDLPREMGISFYILSHFPFLPSIGLFRVII